MTNLRESLLILIVVTLFVLAAALVFGVEIAHVIATIGKALDTAQGTP